jgi:hypothetical protein
MVVIIWIMVNKLLYMGKKFVVLLCNQERVVDKLVNIPGEVIFIISSGKC